ncbi:DUF6327 family protein [Flavobacterium sp.]|uniref:DUF6327 family protein n=1 Tax=Flavobacterium sp. TaxID=239 RepID=UPI002CD78DFD|nr:DUF6327 family protein [Flavobacterium sp.]HSD06622.1 DUF6327 family protein [Flavobacterium sp.]
MEKKKYSSYAEIDRDLEILKLEKQIGYQQLLLSVKKTRDSVTPQNIINGFLEPYKDSISNPLRSILQSVIPYLISYFINKRRF